MCFCVLFCFHGNQVTLKIAITVYGDASYLDLSFKLLFGKILEEMVILVRNQCFCTQKKSNLGGFDPLKFFFRFRKFDFWNLHEKMVLKSSLAKLYSEMLLEIVYPQFDSSLLPFPVFTSVLDFPPMHVLPCFTRDATAYQPKFRKC